MDTNFKIVREALLARNFFKYDGTNGKESLRNLQTATNLQSIIITIEKSMNFNTYDFQYNPENCKFIRLHKTENSEHYTTIERCRNCSTPCFKSEYSIEEFIENCQQVFEPICVKLA